jgi:hypothetical protein
MKIAGSIATITVASVSMDDESRLLADASVAESFANVTLSFESFWFIGLKSCD